jgi:NDP-sugar pyrophosphorylase family protein
VRAFVLAGGLGTRLRPRFGELPKALTPLRGRPFLQHQLEWLAAHGVREVVVCAGYGAAELEVAFGDGARFGVRLHYSVEPEPLGTGGALRLAARWVRGPALVLNGDTLWRCDPWGLERERWEHGALGALALFQVADAGGGGRVERDEAGLVTRFVEKDPAHRGAAWVNGGLYAFAPGLWRRLAADGVSSLECDLLPRLAAEGRLRAVPMPGDLFDIGTPEGWERAERESGA